MALSTKLVAASVNRTAVNAPYAPTAVKRLFETANNLNPRTHKVTAIPAWIAGSRKRLDGSVQSKTFVNVAPVGAINQQRHSSSSAIGGSHTRIVPDFSKYRRPNTGEDAHRAFTYALIGATGVLTAAGTKSFVVDVLSSLAASADTLALAKVEVNLNKIPEGRNATIKWRGKPVFVRHRTADEIASANSVNMAELKDPQPDADRVKKPEWLVMIGVCTHLGCVPVGESGDYGGWYCPCHGSHYDVSGRVRKGPAPVNLEIPEYEFEDDDKLIIG